VASKRRNIVSVIVYEMGVPVVKWRMWPIGEGTEIEQTSIKGFRPYRMALNLMMLIEQLANPIWSGDIKRLITLLDNDRADEELEEEQHQDDELPF